MLPPFTGYLEDGNYWFRKFCNKLYRKLLPQIQGTICDYRKSE